MTLAENAPALSEFARALSGGIIIGVIALAIVLAVFWPRR